MKLHENPPFFLREGIIQFRDQEIAVLQTKQNYEDVLNYFTGMMRFPACE